MASSDDHGTGTSHDHLDWPRLSYREQFNDGDEEAGRKRWEDNIKEWTGLEWNILLRKAENREEWRKLAAKSTVVPQQSARLLDRSDKKKPRSRPENRNQ